MRINHYFKKNLDVPQEPPVEAWDYIQQHLDQKSSKRKPVVPIWFKTSGIAALFLLMIGTAYLMDWNFISPSDAKPNSQTKDQSTNPTLVKTNTDAQPENSDEETNSGSSYLQSVANSSLEMVQSAVRSHENSSWSNVSTSELQVSANSSIPSHQYSNNTNIYDVNSTFQSDNSNSIQNNSILPTSPDQLNSNSNDASIAEIRTDWNPEYLNSDKILEKIMEEPLPEKTSKNLLASTKKSNDKPKNPIKKKVEFDRFHISGFISPMAMNTFVGNSMLADEMSQYNTENNVLLAYGMKGAYAVSPKVKIRAGVSVIGFEQITKDVPFSYEIDGSNSALISRESNHNIKYNGSLRIDNIASLTSTDLTNNIGTGDVKQQSQYIEIPIEAEVSLFKTNSIGISATGGGSTWLLSKNKILAETNEFTQELGKADNLNKTSFSANAGLKFDMNLTDNIQLNVEPTFKYLINPVNDIKNFNPYTVGVNAGVSISIK